MKLILAGTNDANIDTVRSNNSTCLVILTLHQTALLPKKNFIFCPYGCPQLGRPKARKYWNNNLAS